MQLSTAHGNDLSDGVSDVAVRHIGNGPGSGTAVSTAEPDRREKILQVLTAGDPATPLLQRVCEVSVELLGVTGAGMCLIVGQFQQVLSHGTDPVITALEDLQVTLRQGPCMQAVRTSSPILVPDLGVHLTWTWPRFAEAARRRGVQALFSFPLHADTVEFGALDLYRLTPGPLSGPQTADALLLTELATQAALTQLARVDPDIAITALHQSTTGPRITAGGPDTTGHPRWAGYP